VSEKENEIEFFNNIIHFYIITLPSSFLIFSFFYHPLLHYVFFFSEKKTELNVDDTALPLHCLRLDAGWKEVEIEGRINENPMNEASQNLFT
jgi:hypothetical protein